MINAGAARVAQSWRLVYRAWAQEAMQVNGGLGGLTVAIALLGVAGLSAADQTVAPLVVNASSPAGLQVTTAVADGTNIVNLARFGPTSGLTTYNDTEQRVVVYGSGDNTNGRTTLALQQNGSSGVRSAYLTSNGINTSRIATGSGGLVNSVQLFSDSAQPLQFGTNNTARMTLDASGNVGIGAAPVAGMGQLQIQPGSGNVVVRLNGGNSITGDGSAYVCGQGGGYNQAIGNWSSIVGGAYDNTGLLFSATSWKFTTGGIGVRMQIDNTGNVGIGGTPGARLDVYGNQIVRGSIVGLAPAATDAQINTSVTGSGTVGVGLNCSGSTNAFGAPNNSVYLGTGHGFPLVLTTIGAERMRIDGVGNVGIGAAPTARFQVTDTAGDSLAMYQPVNNAFAIQTLLDGHALSGYGTYGAGENRLLLQPLVGMVGIGTTNPLSTLDVAGSVHATGAVQFDGQTRFGKTSGGTYSGNFASIINDQYPGFGFYAAGVLKSELFADAANGDFYVDVASNRSFIVRDGMGGTGGALLQASKGVVAINNPGSTAAWFENDAVYGVGSPTLTTRSAGTKMVLYPAISASTADYAIGIESGTQWASVPGVGNEFAWYAGTTQVARLNGGGPLLLGPGAVTPGGGMLQLPSGANGANGTDHSRGIAFGTDTFIYRSLATDGTTPVLKTDSVVAIGGTSNYNVNGVNAAGAKLFVRGKIAAQEVVVMAGSWADHVLAADYLLPPLREVSAYVAANQHLPGIPSEADVVRDGIGTADMLTKHMAKIEELTLYAIKADQRADALAAENAELRRKLDAVQAAQTDVLKRLAALEQR